jgi:hypothetical protein
MPDNDATGDPELDAILGIAPAVAGPLGDAHADELEQAVYQAGRGMVLRSVTRSPAGTTIVDKQIAPDTKAALATLARLRPNAWRPDTSSGPQLTVIIGDMSAAAMRARLKNPDPITIDQEKDPPA